MSKTVHVCIAVAVDEEGRWTSGGWGPDAEYENGEPAYLRDGLPDDRDPPLKEHVVWIEADVPLPEALVIRGKVKP